MERPEGLKEPVNLRRLVGYDIFILGGVFAILCQFAHPAIASGSFKHSSFNNHLITRLINTYRYLNAVVYGTAEEQRAIFSVVNKLHSRVRGPDYDARDPESQKWTAATLFVAFLQVHETFCRNELELAEKEAILQEFAGHAASLQMPMGEWPASLEEFWGYWNSNVATLEVTDEARILARRFLYPVKMPVQMRLMLPLTRLVTMRFLPPRLAREYGLEPWWGSRLLFIVTSRIISSIHSLLPSYYTKSIHRYFMRDLKAAVEMIHQTGHWDMKRKTDEEWCRDVFGQPALPRMSWNVSVDLRVIMVIVLLSSLGILCCSSLFFRNMQSGIWQISRIS